jgi:glutaredoxin-related protein
MWDIGDLLKEYLSKNEIAPHALYRKIYGKSEGSKNVVQKSYITREFLGRSYRIRNIFNTKNEIETKLPNLRRFTTFREAMPFFDNEKYQLKGEDMKNLLEILNSQNSSKAMKEVKKLQKKHIGIKNPRDQKLKELSEDKDVFIDFYNFIYDLSKKNQEERKKILREENINRPLIEAIIQDTSALTQDGLILSEVEYKDIEVDTKWLSYLEFLQRIKSQNNPKIKRRFRRLVNPRRMMTLAEMLNRLKKDIQ